MIGSECTLKGTLAFDDEAPGFARRWSSTSACLLTVSTIRLLGAIERTGPAFLSSGCSTPASHLTRQSYSNSLVLATAKSAGLAAIEGGSLSSQGLLAGVHPVSAALIAMTRA